MSRRYAARVFADDAVRADSKADGAQLGNRASRMSQSPFSLVLSDAWHCAHRESCANTVSRTGFEKGVSPFGVRMFFATHVKYALTVDSLCCTVSTEYP